jgi:DNA helicase IV
LSVNYRTPAEIMALAERVVPGVAAPVSVRRTGVPPSISRVEPGEVEDAVRRAVKESGDGTVAVIVPPGSRLDVPGTVLTPREAKGLEFDVVVVVEPGKIGSPADLYVALTRATQRLGIVHAESLPAALRVE